MQENKSEIKELTNILLSFIQDQQKWNKNIEEKIENLDTKFENKFAILDKKIDSVQISLEEKIEEKFNILDTKIDKVQYFLEEALATNTEFIFWEQEELTNNSFEKYSELKKDVVEVKNDLFTLTSKINSVLKFS